MSRTCTAFGLCLVLMSAGCQDPPAVAPTPPPPADPTSAVPVFEITPAAAGLIKGYQVSLGLPDPVWFRLTLPEKFDRAAPTYKVELSMTEPGANDYGFLSGGIFCVVLKEQADWFAGAIIDQGEKDGDWSLTISSPRVLGGEPVWVAAPQ